MHYGFFTLALICCTGLSFSQAYADEVTPETLAAETEEAATAQPHPLDLERPQVISRSQLAAAELARRYPDQLIELPSSAQQFQALYLPANAPTAKGLIVFVPGLYETADSVVHIAQLRQSVTDKGWDSLSLNMPDPYIEPMRIESRISEAELAATLEADAPEDETLDDEEIATDSSNSGDPQIVTQSELISAAPSAADTDTLHSDPDDAATLESLLNSTLIYANEHAPQELIFIAQHEGAYWLLTHLAKHNKSSINAILLINARQPAQATQSFASLITQLDIKIVDIYSNSHASHAFAAKQRANASARKASSDFEQFAINAASKRLAYQQTQAKVLGWLHNYPLND